MTEADGVILNERVALKSNDKVAYLPIPMHNSPSGTRVFVMVTLGYAASVDRHVCWWPCKFCGRVAAGFFLPEDLVRIDGGQQEAIN